MAKTNETVAEVAKEFGKNIALMRKCKCVGVSLWNCLKFKLRLEAAHEREIVELLRRLNVAEDALTELQTRCVASVHDGTINPYEALKIVEDALAAIRGKGGAE